MLIPVGVTVWDVGLSDCGKSRGKDFNRRFRAITIDANVNHG
jgi:hypothetical protein